ncbi:SIP domain-containing protein [Streptomyces sp. NPDC048514]|uniref:SIP domain-containing protein n=1 Tax=Streptomyces sp. NPDC048514 TaxID=3365564 RepID=UPI00371CB637
MGRGRGWEGAVLRLLRARDFVFTVTGAEDVTPHYRRLRLSDGELPAVLDGVPDPCVWIACDTATTRALACYVRKELGVPKQRMHALGYWRAD